MTSLKHVAFFINSPYFSNSTVIRHKNSGEISRKIICYTNNWTKNGFCYVTCKRQMKETIVITHIKKAAKRKPKFTVKTCEKEVDGNTNNTRTRKQGAEKHNSEI